MGKPVSLCRVPQYDPAACDAAVERLFASLPCTSEIGPDTKILLKPNLLSKAAPDKAITTHPEIVRAVLRACKRRGAQCGNIVVADSAGGVYLPAQMKAIYQASGLAEVCEAEGVCAYTACETVMVPVPDGKAVREFELLRPVAEADFIIDLPKLKTHMMTGLTAACKNLFGTIPGLKKAEWHMRFPDRERFGEMLIDLLGVVKPRMALLDAVVGMEGDGPSGGEPRPLGLLLASEDLPNLDLAAAQLIGLAPMRVPYLAAAYRRGLCALDFDPADLRGDTDAFVLPTGWKLPASYQDGQNASTDLTDYKSSPIYRPAVNKARCIGCGKCAEICPQHTIEMKNGKSKILVKNCIRCFCCHEMCPVKAIDVKQLHLFQL